MIQIPEIYASSLHGHECDNNRTDNLDYVCFLFYRLYFKFFNFDAD